MSSRPRPVTATPGSVSGRLCLAGVHRTVARIAFSWRPVPLSHHPVISLPRQSPARSLVMTPSARPIVCDVTRLVMIAFGGYRLISIEVHDRLIVALPAMSDARGGRGRGRAAYLPTDGGVRGGRRGHSDDLACHEEERGRPEFGNVYRKISAARSRDRDHNSVRSQPSGKWDDL